MSHKDFFIKFNCPNFTDHITVLKEIQRLLVEYKCQMTECGEIDVLEKMVFRKMTGAVLGRPIPPTYKKHVSDELRP